MSTRAHLAKVARRQALSGWHGNVMTVASNLEPLVCSFPKWTVEQADALWCAAFVYFCCREAGFVFPARPAECRSCTLAGCPAWEEWAMADPRLGYHRAGEAGFRPAAGDIVLFDHVFVPAEHDHIGILLENRGAGLLMAEGNINNLSGILERPVDGHIRAYIRLPDHFHYDQTPR